MTVTTERVSHSFTNRYRLTIEQYYRMGEIGILAPDERTELVEGEIFTMSPIGAKHASYLSKLAERLTVQLLPVAQVRQQNPVRLGDRSEPQPDIAVVQPREDYYSTSHPTPQEIFLLVEVSDSTLQYDRTVKLPLYAQTGILEAWIVNLEAQTLEVYRNSNGDSYQEIKEYPLGESITLQAFSEIAIALPSP